MSFFTDILSKLSTPAPKGTGVILDTRPQEEKDLDTKFQEIVASAAPVVWVEKPQDQWRKFPIFDQNGSGSCVAQTMAKLMGIMYWLKNGEYVHFSATHIFQRRINRPQSGMGSPDVFNIAKKGVTLEVLTPSQSMTDAQMDAVKIEKYKEDVGTVFKIGDYVVLPVADIETVASVIQKTGKGVMVWFAFKNGGEWSNEPQVLFPGGNYDSDMIHHSVTAVDPILRNGKKALVIEDSWGKNYGYTGQRVIDQDFFKKRNIFAAYPMNFAFDATQTDPNKPKHMFTTMMKFSPIVVKDPEVVHLQNCLKYEGLFPKNVDSTGYYGGVTVKAVQAFKTKYGLDGDGKSVESSMIIRLNELYNN